MLVWVYTALGISLLAIAAMVGAIKLSEPKYTSIKEEYKNKTRYIIYERRAIYFKVAIEKWTCSALAETMLSAYNEGIIKN